MDIFWLLFVVFFIPLCCFFVMLSMVLRGMYFGYCKRKRQRMIRSSYTALR